MTRRLWAADTQAPTSEDWANAFDHFKRVEALPSDWKELMKKAPVMGQDIPKKPVSPDDPAACPQCKGSGRANFGVCNNCFGDGKVDPADDPGNLSADELLQQFSKTQSEKEQADPSGLGPPTHDDEVKPWGNRLERALYKEFMDWWPTSESAKQRRPEDVTTNWSDFPHEPITHWLNVEDFLGERHPDAATGGAYGYEHAQPLLQQLFNNNAPDDDWLAQHGYVGTGNVKTQAMLNLHNKLQNRSWASDHDKRQYMELMLRHFGPGAAKRLSRLVTAYRRVAAIRTAEASNYGLMQFFQWCTEKRFRPNRASLSLYAQETGISLQEYQDIAAFITSMGMDSQYLELAQMFTGKRMWDDSPYYAMGWDDEDDDDEDDEPHKHGRRFWAMADTTPWHPHIKTEQNLYTLKHPEHGFLGELRYRINGPQADVQTLVVHPDFQKKGIGQALIERLMQDYPDHRINPGGTTGVGNDFTERLREIVPDAKQRLVQHYKPKVMSDEIGQPWIEEQQERLRSWRNIAKRFWAMPAPAPEGLTFRHEPETARGDNIGRVNAYLDDHPVGHLEWLDDKHPLTVVTPRKPGEVSHIHVQHPYRRNSIATEMYDWTKKNVRPDLHHSLRRSELGDQWVNYEQSRSAKKKKKKQPWPGYRDWRGPKPMWFADDEGNPLTQEQIFETSGPKQLYQLLRNDNNFANQYMEYLRKKHNPQVVTARRFWAGPAEDAYDAETYLGDYAPPEKPNIKYPNSSGKWYHVSPHDLEPGTILTPGGGDSTYDYEKVLPGDRQKWVWMDGPEGIDSWYYGTLMTQTAQGVEKPWAHVYEVEPSEGPHPWNGTGHQGHVAPSAKIVRKVDTGKYNALPDHLGGVIDRLRSLMRDDSPKNAPPRQYPFPDPETLTYRELLREHVMHKDSPYIENQEHAQRINDEIEWRTENQAWRPRHKELVARLWKEAMPVGPIPEGTVFKYREDFPLNPDGGYHPLGGSRKMPAVYAVNNYDILGHITWKPDGEIRMIQVHPDYRRHGIGTRLFDEAKKYMPDIHHSPWKSDDGEAWADYEKQREEYGPRPDLGFMRPGDDYTYVNRGYYQDEER